MEFLEFWKQKDRMCQKNKSCENCMVKGAVETCLNYIRLHPAQAEAYVKDWATKHPIKTNRDKFEEVFSKHISTSFDHNGYFIIDSLFSQDSALAWLNEEYNEKEEE